jgi:hypothetical protein
LLEGHSTLARLTGMGIDLGSALSSEVLDGLILPRAAVPAQTRDGSVVWDFDDELLTVGTGSGRKTMLDTTAAAAAYQPLDSDLTAIAALATTSFGRALLALADAAALRTAAGTVIGTDVEAHDADLTDDVLQRKSGAWTNRTIAQLLVDFAAAGTTFQPLDSDLTAIAALTTTSFGRSLLALADAAALSAALSYGSSAAAVGTSSAGAATTPSRSDHVHATGAGTPAAVSTANSTGTGPAAAMTDHVHAHETGHVAHDTIFDAAGDLVQGTGADTAAKLAISVPAANILNVVGVVNGETSWSVKSVHDGTAPVAVGTAAAGTALTSAHRDHVHATGAGTPSTQAFGDAAATGTGPAAAMTDHKHAMPALGTGSTNAAAGNDSRFPTSGEKTWLTNGLAGSVAFPATQAASADANTLDDYEEGSWTPALAFATPSTSSWAVTTQTGYYTKIGRQVGISFVYQGVPSSYGSASGNLNITGLPFTSGSGATPGFQWGTQMQGWTKASYTMVTAGIGASSATGTIGISGSGQAIATMGVGDVPSGGTVLLRAAGIYFV